MYFIFKGSCSVLTDNFTLLKRMEKGEHFGEVSLLTGQRRTAYVRSNSFSVLASLGKSNFDKIMREYPKQLELIMEAMPHSRRQWVQRVGTSNTGAKPGSAIPGPRVSTTRTSISGVHRGSVASAGTSRLSLALIESPASSRRSSGVPNTQLGKLSQGNINQVTPIDFEGLMNGKYRSSLINDVNEGLQGKRSSSSDGGKHSSSESKRESSKEGKRSKGSKDSVSKRAGSKGSKESGSKAGARKRSIESSRSTSSRHGEEAESEPMTPSSLRTVHSSKLKAESSEEEQKEDDGPSKEEEKEDKPEKEQESSESDSDSSSSSSEASEDSNKKDESYELAQLVDTATRRVAMALEAQNMICRQLQEITDRQNMCRQLVDKVEFEPEGSDDSLRHNRTVMLEYISTDVENMRQAILETRAYTDRNNESIDVVSAYMYNNPNAENKQYDEESYGGLSSTASPARRHSDDSSDVDVGDRTVL